MGRFDFQLWNQDDCPDCRVQIVVSVGAEAQLCVYDGVPGLRPGMSSTAEFELTAPLQRGLYDIRYRSLQAVDCAAAQAAFAANGLDQTALLGKLVVTSPPVTYRNDFTTKISHVDLNGGGIRATVTAGEQVAGQLDFQIWNQDGCPGCISQIVVGIDGDAQTCVFDGIPGQKPGVSDRGRFELVVPNLPGTYDIRYSSRQEYGCADARQAYEADGAQQAIKIGTLTVVAAPVAPPLVSEPPVTPEPQNRDPINDYIWSLSYDPDRMLSVQPNGSTHAQPVNTRQAGSSAVIICTKQDHVLRENLTELAIMRPTNGVIYPGAVILANQRMAEGLPVPVTLPRAPMVLSIDLPGLAESARITSPANDTVQAAVNQLLAQWNRMPASQGYINTSRSFYDLTTGYALQQVALDLGLNAEWASGTSFASQLRVNNSTEKSTVVLYYKQVFYTVTMNTPETPADFFDPHVTRDELARVVNSANPPAYVRSVDYGRILMVKMETTAHETKVNLELALKRAMGLASAEGSLGASYEEIIRNANFTVVKIGGGASQSDTFTNVASMNRYIENGAVYSPGNPGAPIAYTVAFLQDNRVAKMGFTTDYTETNCVQHPNGYVRLWHDAAYIAQFEVSWDEPDANGGLTHRQWNSGEQTAGYKKTVALPGDARNVRIQTWGVTGLAWNWWGEVMNVTESGPTNMCYRAMGTTLDMRYQRRSSCP